MRKLLIIAPSFAPNQGGVESHLKNIIPLLIEDYDVTVICRYSNSIPRSQNFNGVSVIRLPKSSIGIRLWSIFYSSWLRKFDAIHTHDFFPMPIYKRASKTSRWIHTFHGYEGFPLNEKAVNSRRQINNLVDSTIGVGKFIEKWYGTKCDEWIYGGVEIKSLPQKKKPVWDIVFYGRLEPDTGVKTYLESLNLLAQKNNPKLLVVGSGSLKNELQDYSDKHDLGVEFKDFSDNVLQDVASSRVAFVSGYLAIIESAAIGLNIISVFDTPIKKDYLEMHPMSGHFDICSSFQEVADSYNKIKDNRVDAHFQTWAKNQTWEKIVKLYLKYYE